MLFTDIEGSTRLLEELGPGYAAVQQGHLRILRDAISDAGGVEVVTEGDAFFAVFRTPLAAVACATEAQRRLASHDWPHGEPLRIRMGMHTGEAAVVAGGYVGIDVNIAARIAASAHGGQVIVSEATRGLVARSLPPGIGLLDLGEQRLKDIAHQTRLYQLTIEGLRNDFPPPRTLVGARRTNLPADRTSFVGRQAEQAALRNLIERSRLVTLIGAGGTGKTRLMLHVTSRLVDRYEDGVWLVDLARINEGALVVPEVVRAVEALEEPGRPLIEVLIDFLRAKSLVLLLDNCEHLVASAADLVESVLSSCPGVTIVATSREALGVEGETVFQVPSLALPTGIGPATGGAEETRWLEELLASEAVQLFVERAQAITPSFSVTASNAAHIADICRQLDGIPLALELAAARLSVLSVEEIARGLSDRFRLLTGGRRTAVPRQQTLQALVDWSWDLLDDTDRVLLRRLSVFSGGWTLDGAAAVTGQEAGDRLATLDGLSRLVERSLVIVDSVATGATRYRMLQTIQQYARDRLFGAGEAGAIRDRHLAHFTEVAIEAESALRGPEMIAWLRRLDAELDNLRVALDWSFETDAERAFRLCVALKRYWDARAGAEALERLRRAAQLAQSLRSTAGQTADRGRLILIARVLAAAAQAHAVTAEAAPALGWAHDAVALARELGDRPTLSDALGALTMASVFAGRIEDMKTARDEALQVAEETEDWWLVTMINAGSSELDAAAGDFERARERLASATTAAQRSKNPLAIAFASHNDAVGAGLLGQLDDARRLFGQAIERYEEMGDQRFVLIARSDFAHALRRGGALDEAEAMYRQTIHDWRRVGNRGAVANQLECFAYAAHATGLFDRAVRLLAAAEALREVAAAPMLPYERVEYDAAVQSLRDQVDPVAFEAAWQAGRRLDLEDAVALALDKPSRKQA
jgi:predicted ATPase/class 3 adenylate cyclase